MSNPLSQKYLQPVHPPHWPQIYANLDQPLHLDIGCGRGYFLQQMAQLQPNWNFLGLEIREPLVKQALERRDQQMLTNLHFLFCNANISLQSLLKSWPASRLKQVTIQFPDPWFKKRHQKRRLVQPALVSELAKLLLSGGVVILQSDVESVALEMCDRFQANPGFCSHFSRLARRQSSASNDRTGKNHPLSGQAGLSSDVPSKTPDQFRLRIDNPTIPSPFSSPEFADPGLRVLIESAGSGFCSEASVVNLTGLLHSGCSGYGAGAVVDNYNSAV